YILIAGQLDVHVDDDQGFSRRVGQIDLQTSFGEMSVLAGQPRNATVVVPSEAEATVLEIQRPALRLLRKLKEFGTELESNYRQHGLDRTFLEVEKASHSTLNPELSKKLKNAARFTVHPKDHILFQEGDPIETLFFINSGWVRRVRGITSDVKLSRTV